MKNLKIEIKATAMTFEITCNGATQKWERTGIGSAKRTDKSEWPEEFSEDLIDNLLDRIGPLDAMYECGPYKQRV